LCKSKKTSSSKTRSQRKTRGGGKEEGQPGGRGWIKIFWRGHKRGAAHSRKRLIDANKKGTGGKGRWAEKKGKRKEGTWKENSKKGIKDGCWEDWGPLYDGCSVKEKEVTSGCYKTAKKKIKREVAPPYQEPSIEICRS